MTNGPMTRRHPVSQEHKRYRGQKEKMLEVPGELALRQPEFEFEWIFLFFFGPRVRQTGQGTKV